MKKIILTIVICLAIVLAGIGFMGCPITPDQRINAIQNAIVQGQEISAGLGKDVNSIQAALEKGKIITSDPNIDLTIRQKMEDYMRQAQNSLAATMTKKTQIDLAINQWKAELDKAIAEPGGIDVGKEIELYGQGIGSAAPALPPPYGSYAYLLSAALTLIGGILGKKIYDKNQTINESKATTTDIVKSVDKLLEFLPKDIQPAAIDVLKNAQQTDTRIAVMQIKSPDYNTAPVA